MTSANKNEVELPRHWFQGARATDGGPQLSEAMLEEACEWIARAHIGVGFAFFYWARDYLQRHERVSMLELAYEWQKLQRPRMRKEFVPLYEGNKLIGQMTIERPFEARDYLPFVQRVHPDDQAKLDELLPTEDVLVCLPAGARVQRFNLHRGRYVLAGTET